MDPVASWLEATLSCAVAIDVCVLAFVFALVETLPSVAPVVESVNVMFPVGELPKLVV